MLKKVAILAAGACCALYAGGYKIPEQSSDSLGLLASNVAVSFGADAAYFNPANMIFLGEGYIFEGTLGWFHIDKADFKANGRAYASKKFDSAAGTFSYVSPEIYENWRFGLALAVPAAVGMAWEDPVTAFGAKRFKLQVVELNPTVAYCVTPQLAVALGARAVYSKGVVANDYGALGYREIKGDGLDYGYNVAATYRPVENFSLAATYRSKVDLNLDGDAEFNSPVPGASYSGGADVTIPLPAQLVLAAGYKISDFTILLAYERTYWSKFTGYDFDYKNKRASHRSGLSGAVFRRLMDDPVSRAHKDTNSYRVGLAYDATQRLRLMAGFVYDEDISSPQDTGLELPNTNSRAYSAGLNYKFSDQLELGLGFMCQDRSKKSVSGIKAPPAGAGIDGEVGRARITITAATIKYKF